MTNPKPSPSPNIAATLSRTWAVDRINVYFRLRHFLKLAARRWIILAVTIILSLAGGIFVAINTPNVYQAGSKIGIAPKIQTAFGSKAQYQEELNNFYENQLQYMNSSLVLAEVHKKMLASAPAQPTPSAFPRAVKGPGIFSMVVESSDFDWARRYAQTWADEFITFKNSLRENALGRSAASTRSEILRYEKNLTLARNALLQFQKRNNLGSIKETGDAAQLRLDKLESDYQDVKTLRQRLETKTAEQIANSLISPAQPTASPTQPTPPDNNPSLSPTSDPLARFDSSSKYSDLQFQIRSQQGEHSRLLTTLKPGHPHMIRLTGEIQRLQQELNVQLELIEEKRVARIKSLQDDERSYRPLIDDLRTQVLASRNVQYEFERLKEDETNLKESLSNLRRAEESLSSTSAVNDGTFHIIEAGVGSPIPVRPNRPKIIAAALVLGAGLGLGLIYLLGRLDDRLELSEEIQAALNEPVLGQIPQMDLKKTRLSRPMVTELDQHHMFSESLRSVRSAVLLNADHRKKQVLAMTSAVPGDGKTTVTVNFAVTLAIAGHRVLLVDADLRRGDTHNFFNNQRDGGFADVLAGTHHWSEIVKPTQIPTLQVIHSGKLPPNPGELLASPVTQQFIDDVRDSFDYVLFDCPPLTAIDDTFSMARLVDGLLFIVRSGQTSMRFAKNALDVVRQRGAHIFGIVVNGVTEDNPYYYYRNYYHAYYSKDQPPTTVLSTHLSTPLTMAPRGGDTDEVVSSEPAHSHDTVPHPKSVSND